MFILVCPSYTIITTNSFNFILSKVRSKLNGWEAKKLSLADRITLAKSVLLAIPNYFMGTVHILMTIFNKIEKVARQFIWGSTLESKKPALFPWKDCCRPMERGGLVIRNLGIQNKICLLKLGFLILTDKDALWVQLIRNKYNMFGELPNSINRSSCSYLWRSLSNVWQDVINNVYWSLRNGCLINFWNDVWVP